MVAASLEVATLHSWPSTGGPKAKSSVAHKGPHYDSRVSHLGYGCWMLPRMSILLIITKKQLPTYVNFIRVLIWNIFIIPPPLNDLRPQSKFAPTSPISFKTHSNTVYINLQYFYQEKFFGRKNKAIKEMGFFKKLNLSNRSQWSLTVHTDRR